MEATLKPRRDLEEKKGAKTMEKRLHIRIDEDLHENLKEQAKKENRTISNYVISLIKNELEKEKRK